MLPKQSVSESNNILTSLVSTPRLLQAIFHLATTFPASFATFNAASKQRLSSASVAILGGKRSSRAANTKKMGGGSSKGAQLQKLGHLFSDQERKCLNRTFHVIAGYDEATFFSRSELQVSDYWDGCRHSTWKLGGLSNNFMT